jgi:3-methylcrotonyl-CoA carboxylase beta subunit
VADYLVNDDAHALSICRKIISGSPPIKKRETGLKEPVEPQGSPDDIYGHLPVDLKKPVDMAAIIEHLVDGSHFLNSSLNTGKR